MIAIDPFHLRIAEIALAVAEKHGFALGGGLALNVYGVVQRPTEDVDLFSDHPASVPAATELVVAALERAGIPVTIEAEESDLRDVIPDLDGHLVELTAYRDAADQVGVRLSLGQLYRAHHPVVLDVGPVLHLDDLRAWKVAALVARSEPRDLVDVAAFLADREVPELLALARTGDPGMEPEDIAAVGRRLDETPDRLLTRYGLDAAAVAELRRRFALWPRTAGG
jgi:hypothetical protein